MFFPLSFLLIRLPLGDFLLPVHRAQSSAVEVSTGVEIRRLLSPPRRGAQLRAEATLTAEKARGDLHAHIRGRGRARGGPRRGGGEESRARPGREERGVGAEDGVVHARDGRRAGRGEVEIDVEASRAPIKGAHEEVDASHLARQSVERRSHSAEDEADGRREMVNVQRMVYE